MARMPTELVVRIEGDFSKFNVALAQASTSLKRFAERMNKALQLYPPEPTRAQRRARRRELRRMLREMRRG